MVMDGAVYFPRGKITLSGSSSAATKCAMIVARRVHFGQYGHQNTPRLRFLNKVAGKITVDCMMVGVSIARDRAGTANDRDCALAPVLLAMLIGLIDLGTITHKMRLEQVAQRDHREGPGPGPQL